jgi:hypothetical protein
MTKATIGARRESIVVALCLLGVAVLFALGTLRLVGESRVVPTSVLVPLLPLLGVVLWRALKSPSSSESLSPPADAGQLSVLAWIVALPALVTAVGLVAGSALFMTLWLRRRSGEHWWIAIAAGLTTAAALWLLGATVLEGLPRGGLLQSMLIDGVMQ